MTSTAMIGPGAVNLHPGDRVDVNYRTETGAARIYRNAVVVETDDESLTIAGRHHLRRLLFAGCLRLDVRWPAVHLHPDF